MILALVLTIVVISAVCLWPALMYELNSFGQCRVIEKHSKDRFIFDFVVWVSIPSIGQLICTVVIIVQLFRRWEMRTTTSIKDRLTNPEIRLSAMLIIMDIIYIFGTSFFTIQSYLMYINALFDSYNFFIYDLAFFASCLGTYTDWIFILGMGTGVRRAFKDIFCFRSSKKLIRSALSRATTKSNDSSPL